MTLRRWFVLLLFAQKVDDAAERLVRLGHRGEAIPLVIKHAARLTNLARAATESNIQHAYYLEVCAAQDASFLSCILNSSQAFQTRGLILGLKSGTGQNKLILKIENKKHTGGE